MTNSAGTSPTAADLARDPVLLDDLLENGQGVGRVDGLVTFVTGGLPGELVRIAVDERKRNYVSAHAVAIERASSDRVEPGCPVFPRCGGCQSLHLAYPAELAWKRRMVIAAFERLGGLRGVDVDDVVSAVAVPAGATAVPGYRNKATMVSRFIDGRGRLGFFGARSHRLVPIDGCPVLIGPLATIVERLVAFAREAPQVFRDVQHVVARASATGPEAVVSFNGRGPNKALVAAIDSLRTGIPELTGIAANWEPTGENVVFGRRSATLWGSPMVRERVGDATFAFGVSSFFQINTAVLALLAERITTRFADASRVVDLYSGVGTFGVLLGKRGIATTGVESFRPAVDEAAANAAENGVTNASFECADASEATAGERGRTLLAGADAVILDPPRKGCDPPVLAALAGSRAARIAYVSCNPATLARDAKALAAGGYRIERVSPFDMFPRTGHVEVLAQFVAA